VTVVEADLVGTLAAITTVLDGSGVRYAVIGGIAKAAWGRARATRDIDIAVSLDSESFIALRSHLVVAGFQVTKMVGGDAEDERPDIFVARGSHGVPVDMLIAKTPFEEEAVSRGVVIELLGQSVRVVTPEDLVFYKLLAGRPRDRDDNVDVVRTRIAGAHAFDWDRLECLAKDWGIEPALAELRRTISAGA